MVHTSYSMSQEVKEKNWTANGNSLTIFPVCLRLLNHGFPLHVCNLEKYPPTLQSFILKERRNWPVKTLKAFGWKLQARLAYDRYDNKLYQKIYVIYGK